MSATVWLTAVLAHAGAGCEVIGETRCFTQDQRV